MQVSNALIMIPVLSGKCERIFTDEFDCQPNQSFVNDKNIFLNTLP